MTISTWSRVSLSRLPRPSLVGHIGSRTTDSPTLFWESRTADGSVGHQSLSGRSRIGTRTMDVLVAGSHGQVGQQITKILSRSDHTVRGMVRDEAQVADIEAMGAEAVVADLTQDVSHAVTGRDAVIFAAGSGGV